MLETNEIIAVIGAITGSISLGILIYKTWKEKPKLDFIIESAYWYIHTKDDPMYNAIYVTLRIDNKGERSTTIHTIHFNFEYAGKSPDADPRTQPQTTIEPHSSQKKLFDIFLKRDEIKLEGDLKNFKVMINHTHGKKELVIPLIKESK